VDARGLADVRTMFERGVASERLVAKAGGVEALSTAGLVRPAVSLSFQASETLLLGEAICRHFSCDPSAGLKW
jgi:hypothetical protein